MSEYKEVIYNIIVPILVVIIPWFLQNFSGWVKKDKPWKQSKEKSSLNIYFKFLLSIILFGFIWDLLIVFLINYYAYIFNINYNIKIYNILIFILYILPYIILLIISKENNREVNFKRGLKFEKKLKRIVDVVTIISAAIMQIFVLGNNSWLLKLIAIILITLDEIIYFVFLDSNGKFKYSYAKFVFYNGNIVDNISIKQVYQKGKWIIARSEKCNVEYRFRIKDIERVEYRKTIF